NDACPPPQMYGKSVIALPPATTRCTASGTLVGIGIVPLPPTEKPPATGVSTRCCAARSRALACSSSPSSLRISASDGAPAATAASPAARGEPAGRGGCRQAAEHGHLRSPHRLKASAHATPFVAAAMRPHAPRAPLLARPPTWVANLDRMHDDAV